MKLNLENCLLETDAAGNLCIESLDNEVLLYIKRHELYMVTKTLMMYLNVQAEISFKKDKE